MKKLISALAVLMLCATATAQSNIEWGVKAGALHSSTAIGIQELSLKATTSGAYGFYLGGVGTYALSDKFAIQGELLYRASGMNISASKYLANSVLAMMSEADMFDEFSNTEPSVSDKVKATWKTHYIDIPVLFKYSPIENFSLLAGPYLSFRVASSMKFNDEVDDLFTSLEVPSSTYSDVADELLGDLIKSFNLGLSFGLEYEFQSGVFIDARYNVAVLNKFKNNMELGDIKINGSYVAPGETTTIEDVIGTKVKVRDRFLQVGVGYRF